MKFISKKTGYIVLVLLQAVSLASIVYAVGFNGQNRYVFGGEENLLRDPEHIAPILLDILKNTDETAKLRARALEAIREIDGHREFFATHSDAAEVLQEIVIPEDDTDYRIAAKVASFMLEKDISYPDGMPDWLKGEGAKHIATAKQYAVTMIEKGRDRYGEEHSPLFASALDRDTHRLLEEGFIHDSAYAAADMHHHKRPSGGSNPQDHAPLYGLLYQLSDFSNDPDYAEAADQAIEWFFNNTRHPETDLLAWGEHMYWDLRHDRAGTCRNMYHEPVWIPPFFKYWDETVRLAPEAFGAYAHGLWEHQIWDHDTGHHDRHIKYDGSRPTRGGRYAFVRHAAYYITIWAREYDREQDPEMHRAIETIADWIEGLRRPEGGLGASQASRDRDSTWYNLDLHTSRFLYYAAERIKPYDQELAGKLVQTGERSDEAFLDLPHDIASEGIYRRRNTTTSLWDGWNSTAAVANDVYSLSSVTNNDEHREEFQKMVVEAADVYLEAMPDKDRELPPSTFSAAIRLMLNAYELTGDKGYLERGDYLGHMARELFFDFTSPLPKVTNLHDWYETQTGGAALVKTLFELGAL